MKKDTTNDDESKLKLIYVNKIGKNGKGEGLYEFMFAKDSSNIDIEGWCWDLTPACDNALPPSEDHIDLNIGLKTKSFELFCLHEAVDRAYIHGYHTIHALAYETENNDDDGYDKMFNQEEEDYSLLVFHYGMTLSRIKDMLNIRKIILKNNEFVEVNTIKI